MYKQQARYLVERQDLDLWAKVLTEVEGETNEHRRSVIDSVGGADRAARDQEPRRRLDHGQGIYVGPPVQNELVELSRRSYCRAAPS